ncbi:MAG: thiamine-phosphate kinase [Vicinamibacterales bacterium]
MSTPADAAATLESLGERGLVALIRKRFPASPNLLQVGIGDDAAVAVPARGALEVLTTDGLVEGIHFDLAFSSFHDIGYKALAVNVSDIAAMGGTPRLALLSLILPSRLTVANIDAMLDGFEQMASEAGVTLAGGNITTSPGPLVVDVSLLGAVRPRKVLTRSGGRPGDLLYVTGAVGAAFAGLDWLRNSSQGRLEAPSDPALSACVARYRRPEPRFRLGAILGRTRAASACMDSSDGLADAVRQLAGASGTGAAINAALLPVPDCARQWFSSRGADPVSSSLIGGDDYELLFSVPPRRRGRLRHAVRHARGLPVARIGELTASPDLVLIRAGKPEPLPEGFTHFKSSGRS